MIVNSQRMIDALDHNDLTKADDYFNKALTQDDDLVLLELGEYLESIGFWDYAKKLYEKLKSKYVELNLNLAQIVAEDGDFETAFLYLDDIKETSEYYVNALVVQADLYQMEGLADVAKEKLLLATQLSNDPLLFFGLAEIEMELEQYKEAISHYANLDNRFILEITGISTYERIGKAYANIGKFEAAIEFLEKAVTIEYDDNTIFELAVLLADQGEFQRANIFFKQLDTMNPAFEGYEYYYAQSLRNEHLLEEALKIVQQGLSKNEFDYQLLLLASQIAYETHDPKLSETYLLSAKEVTDDLETIYLRLSDLYLEQERFEDLLKIEFSDIDNSLTKWNIAKAYDALEEEQTALKIYNVIFEELQRNPEFLQDYAYLLRKLGQRQKAITIIKSYLNLIPDDGNMQSLLEELY